MNVALPNILPSLSEQLRVQVLSIWKALEARYQQEISADEIDHLLALYTLGLTTPFYGQQSAAEHWLVCHELVGAVLPAERAEQALSAVPVPSQHWVEVAFASIEQLGGKDGQSLFDQQQNSNQTSNAIELTSPTVPAAQGRQHD